jgi:hypothetical protein
LAQLEDGAGEGARVIHAYIHVDGRRVKGAEYSSYEDFGPAFPCLRAERFFNEDHGPHRYRVVASGQEGLDYAFHLEATRELA